MSSLTRRVVIGTGLIARFHNLSEQRTSHTLELVGPKYDSKNLGPLTVVRRFGLNVLK
jgi:hypothetical protein